MPMRSGFSISASVLAVALVLGTAGIGAAQEPAPVSVVLVLQPEGLRVSFTCAVVVNANATIDGRELLVTFDGPVRVDLPATFSEITDGWLATVQTGYDTVLLRAARDVRFDVSNRASTIDVLLVPTGPADPLQEVLGQRRLDLLRAQWLAEDGKEAAAFHLLSRLEAHAPTDAQVLTALGLSERRIGWQRTARSTLQRAVATDGSNTDLRELFSTIAAERAPLARLNFEQKTVGGEYRSRSQRTEGARALNGAIQLGGRFELLHVDAQQVRYPDGAIAPLHRLVQWGEMWLRYDARAGSSWLATAFAAPSGPGASVEFERPQPSGQWNVQADVRRPFWEYEEAFAGDGTRDRIAIGRRQKLWRHVDGWVTATATRYALDSGASTTTTGLTGGVVAVLREAAPFVAASYGLDKEARRNGSIWTDATGASFDPVPIQSREVHMPGVQVRHTVGSAFTLDAFVGYAMDRLGGHGAASEVHARFSKHRVSAELWADHRLQTLATTTTVTRVGASLAIRF